MLSFSLSRVAPSGPRSCSTSSTKNCANEYLCHYIGHDDPYDLQLVRLVAEESLQGLHQAGHPESQQQGGLQLGQIGQEAAPEEIRVVAKIAAGVPDRYFSHGQSA